MTRNRDDRGGEDPSLETRRLRTQSREVGIPNYMTRLMDEYNWSSGDAAEYVGYYTRSLMGRDVTMASEIAFSDYERRKIAELEQKYGAPANFGLFKQEHEL